MANNFQRPGLTMTYTAPGGGVVSGTAYLIGSMLVVALTTQAAGVTFEGDTEGVWLLPKATSQVWAEGAILYWDNTAKNFTTTSTANFRAGCVAVAGLSADATGYVRLNGLPVTAVGGVAP